MCWQVTHIDSLDVISAMLAAVIPILLDEGVFPQPLASHSDARVIPWHPRKDTLIDDMVYNKKF